MLAVRRGEARDLHSARIRRECDPDPLRRRPETVLHATPAPVVGHCAPAGAGPEHDVDEIDLPTFPRVPPVPRRIGERELVRFPRAADPLNAVLTGFSAAFATHGVDEELHPRDAEDLRFPAVES